MGELPIDDSEIVARCRDYEELRGALRRRRADLRLSVQELDAISGVQPGYSTKLENGIKNFGNMSMAAILGGLGVELVVVKASSLDDEKPLQQWDKSRAALNKFKRFAQQRGGRAAWGKLLPDERSKELSRRNLKAWRQGARKKHRIRAGGPN